MILSTTNYDMFIFRDDNRESGVHPTHLDRIKRSILKKNLLHLKPIDVNEKLEIIDGQHRLTAAKELGLPIYYKVSIELTPESMVLMNTNRNWGVSDFMNFYCKQGNENYLNLKRFIEHHKIGLRTALMLTKGSSLKCTNDFKDGLYEFSADMESKEIEMCWETIHYIQRINGSSNGFMDSGKFWKALLVLVKHSEFDMKRWMHNLAKFTNRVTLKATYKDYLEMLLDIFNYRAQQKIYIYEGEIKDDKPTLA